MDSPVKVVEKLNELAPNIGLGYSERKDMINSALFLLGEFVVDMVKFSEWMERTYPEYLNKSLNQFLLDKDPNHIEDWKELFGVGERPLFGGRYE